MRSLRVNLHRWTRDAHSVLGLFISPFLLVFAVSTLLFNHTWKPWESRAEAEKSGPLSVEIPEELEGIDQAQAIMRQVGVSGEIRNIFRPEGRLLIPGMTPGRNTVINVDLITGMAEVEQRKTGFWDVLFYLHKSPGPHNANIRGNWVFTRMWTWLMDTVVYAILLISVSGIYLWTVIKAERKTGLILLGAGCLSFAVMVSTIVF